MIKKLRRRFIRIAMIALTLAMVLVAGVVNIANWVSVRAELRSTLEVLAEYDGLDFKNGMGGRLMGKSKHTRNTLSESNWFAVYYDAEGNVRNMNLSSMAEADEQTALALAGEAARGGAESAFLQDYLYYVKTAESGTRTVVFLNCETKITSLRTLGWISLAACAAGILLAWLIVTLASRRAVEPTLRNMEQQKQFITNASHELKTPLTVISTNMELLQMEHPDNPWIRSTQKQTAQMRHLVDELVYLSRLEEEFAPLAAEKTNLSALVRETAEPFQAMAEFQGREMRVDASEEVSVSGDRASLQRLISTLCDNAVKYAAGEEPIVIRVRSEGRNAVLTVENAVETPLTPEQCAQLFNRFYRADASRSKEKQSGFGIGLAIAAAIAERHGGSMAARMTENQTLRFTCLLPVYKG